MPQLQPLVLKDRAATPKDRTFSPFNIEGGVGFLVERTGIPAGDNTLSISSRKTAGGKYRATIKLMMPVVTTNQSINGVTVVTSERVAVATLEFQFDARSTEQERKDLVGLVQSSLDPAKTLINDAVVKLEGVY